MAAGLKAGSICSVRLPTRGKFLLPGKKHFGKFQVKKFSLKEDGGNRKQCCNIQMTMNLLSVLHISIGG